MKSFLPILREFLKIRNGQKPFIQVFYDSFKDAFAYCYLAKQYDSRLWAKFSFSCKRALGGIELFGFKNENEDVSAIFNDYIRRSLL